MEEDPFEIAAEIREIVDGVRASERRIVAVFVPDERHVYQFPEEVYEELMNVIDETMYQHEYSTTGPDTVEQHEWSGGVHHDPIVTGGEQPANYELQMSFVK